MATVKTTGRVAMTNIDTGEVFGLWDGEQAITIRSVEEYEKAKTKAETAQSKNDKSSTISKSYWDYGRFFWSLYDTAVMLFGQLKPATLTRLMVLGTYMNYENELVEDSGTPMTLRGVQGALGISDRMTRYILEELKGLDILTAKDGVYVLNGAFFMKGRISEADLNALFDDGKSVKRVYADGVRSLYRAASQASVKKLCPIFKIMPYVNKEYNIVCFNPLEKNKSAIRPMSVGDVAEVTGTRRADANRVQKALLEPEFLTSRGMTKAVRYVSGNRFGVENHCLFINPRIYYGGSEEHRKEVDILGQFE